MTRKLKLMTDYQCWPLWHHGGPEVGNVDPDTLPLSQDTRDALQKWADVYDSWLNLDDPANSPAVSDEERDAFEAAGLRLWQRLNDELGPTYQVAYKSRKQGKLLEPPSPSPID